MSLFLRPLNVLMAALSSKKIAPIAGIVLGLKSKSYFFQKNKMKEGPVHPTLTSFWVAKTHCYLEYFNIKE